MTPPADSPVELVERLDMDGLTVILVDGEHGLAIRKWENHGLEGGTHHLVAEPLARTEIERLQADLERAVELLDGAAVQFGIWTAANGDMVGALTEQAEEIRSFIASRRGE